MIKELKDKVEELEQEKERIDREEVIEDSGLMGTRDIEWVWGSEDSEFQGEQLTTSHKKKNNLHTG